MSVLSPATGRVRALVLTFSLVFQVAKEERSFSKAKKKVEEVEEEEDEKEEAQEEMETEERKADEPDDGSTKIESGIYDQE